METVYTGAVAAAGVVLLAVAFLLRDRLSRVYFRFWKVSGGVEAKREGSTRQPQRGLFNLRRNVLKKRSRFSVPASIGLDAEGNKLSDSAIEIRDSTHRDDE